VKFITIANARTNAILCEQRVSAVTTRTQCNAIARNLIRKLGVAYSTCTVSIHGMQLNGSALIK